MVANAAAMYDYIKQTWNSANATDYLTILDVILNRAIKLDNISERLAEHILKYASSLLVDQLDEILSIKSHYLRHRKYGEVIYNPKKYTSLSRFYSDTDINMVKISLWISKKR